ncbi:ABC transporter substrate-binding protein [Oceanomicrobium pacificus]|uniref:ABC transporter substrate-binding protein n=1 Tax=Oceanomicrobium pacificus TaxID=2692916 RepID=A0A6B0TYA2_9RHOB|nr:ABC transporter substrate-binding protein [Oceanomicrobium pacificus]MXU63891.1 ABC transporter substrate-binding protein [Oceanomicrobium pacificus]
MTDVSLTCGFVPLADAGLLIAAVEQGFLAEEGVAVTLQRCASWSSLADRLATGLFDAAHLLSPLALAIQSGAMPLQADLVAPFILGRDGNTLAATPALADHCATHLAGADDPAGLAQALRAWAGVRPLRVGVPFGASMHRLQLLDWLGPEAGDGLSTVVAPPSMLGDVMDEGEIDAFMVGEPYGSLAQARGRATLLMPVRALGQDLPEKLLGLRRDWCAAHPEALAAIGRAFLRTELWLTQPGATAELADILSRPDFLNLPPEAIRRAFDPDLTVMAGQAGRPVLRLGGNRWPDLLDTAADWIPPRMGGERAEESVYDLFDRRPLDSVLDGFEQRVLAPL